MSQKYSISPLARADMRSIAAYIKQDNPPAAERTLRKFVEKFELIAKHPKVGHIRDDLTVKPLSFMNIGNYLIIYTDSTSPPTVLRVLSSFRDITGMI